MSKPGLDRWHYDLLSVLAGAAVAAILAFFAANPLIDPMRQLGVGAYLVIAAVCVLAFFAGHISGFPLRRVVQFLAGFGFTMALIGSFITSMP